MFRNIFKHRNSIQRCNSMKLNYRKMNFISSKSFSTSTNNSTESKPESTSTNTTTTTNNTTEKKIPKLNTTTEQREKEHWKNKKVLRFPQFSVALMGCLIIAYYYDKYIKNPEKYSRDKSKARADSIEEPEKIKPKLVVLGTGWGGLNLLKNIDVEKFQVCVISPTNYFVLTPFLHEVAVGILSATSVSDPLRKYVGRKFDDIDYIDGRAVSIDHENKTVTYEGRIGKKTIDYDSLVLAVGATSVAPKNTLPLSSLADAETIRREIIGAYEKANTMLLNGVSPEETCAAALRFVVVGGSPESSELARKIASFARHLERHQYRGAAKRGAHASVQLVEAGSRARNAYDAKIMAAMAARYDCDDVERVPAVVHGVDDGRLSVASPLYDGVTSSGLWSRLRALFGAGKPITTDLTFSVCIWSAPREPHSFVRDFCRKLGAQHQPHQYAILTDDHLRVVGTDDVYALGDCASIKQTRLIEKVMSMFEDLDVDGDGTLDAGEFRALVERYQHEFPQLAEWADRTDEMFHEADTSGDGRLQADEFRALLLKVDSTLTRLPTSAQTAVQEGRYLARVLSKDASGFDPLATRRGTIDIKKGEYEKDSSGHLPFRYKHVGGFEYVGYDDKITARGSAAGNIIDGHGAMWMWRSVLCSRGVRPGQLLRAGAERVASTISGRDCTND